MSGPVASGILLRMMEYTDSAPFFPGTDNIPAGVKHWHGAADDSWFAHLAIEIAGENASNEWLEPVSDIDYTKVNGK